MTNFSDMLSKAKVMQEKMKEAQDQIKKIEVEGLSGGELVKVVLSGDYEIKSITISDSAKNESQEIQQASILSLMQLNIKEAISPLKELLKAEKNKHLKKIINQCINNLKWM